MSARRVARNRVEASMRARRRAAALLAMVVLLLAAIAMLPAVSVAATSFERPPLHVDRSDVALSDGEWDELQQALRQTRSHGPARFADTSHDIELDNPFAVGEDRCGAAAAMGDVNGDGRDDVLLGCPFNDDGASDTGSVIVFVRNTANTGFEPGIELDNPFPAVGDRCGAENLAKSVSAGDVNGDGREDVLLGCPYNDDGAGDAGSMIVFTRNAANNGFDAGAELDNPFPAASDWCGQTVASGDVNGDGRADVMMGCTLNDDGASSAGSVIVFVRNTTNDGFLAGVEIDNPAPALSDYCGTDIRAGDVNADGRDDLVIGCHADDTGATDAGTIIVLLRNSANTGFVLETTLAAPSPVASDECGWANGIGDVNGDGRPDVVMGCINRDVGAATDAGSAVVFTRNTTNNGFDAGVELANPYPASGDKCGIAEGLVDTNGDGLADVVVGCPYNNDGGTSTGSVVVFQRTAANDGFESGDEFDNPYPSGNDNCGRGIGTGDVNGDGRAEAVAGCRFNDDGATNAGSGVVFELRRGSEELPNPAPLSGDGCGNSVAIGDVNADGASDVVIGCSKDDDGATDAGSAILLLRNAAGAGFLAPVQLLHPSPTASDECGTSVSIADVNGDGRGDVLLGCRLDDVAVSDSGSGVVFTRNTANTGFDPAVVLANPAANAVDECGRAIAAADLNGDGRADVVLGCPGDDGGGATAGNAVVLLRNGANTGFDPGIEVSHPTPAASDFCGYAVAAGDIDGNGNSDIVLGCIERDAGATDGGSAVVLLRNATNSGFAPGVELTHPTPVAADYCGHSIAIGDVDGDARGDVVMGCPDDDTGGSSAGSAIVLRRNAANTGFEAGVEVGHATPAAGDWCGISVAAADVNGDGLHDVLLGCEYEDTGATSAGSVAVAARNAANSGFDPALQVSNPTPTLTDLCAGAIAGGDIDGDGAADMVMGCRGDDTGAIDAGNATVVLSAATGPAGSSGTVSRASELLDPTPGDDRCGMSVATGDVNGDGRADVAMGCPNKEYGLNAMAGNVVLFVRNATNTGYSTVELDNPFPEGSDSGGDWCGASVAMGDVNGDGRDDVVMGCSYDDDGATDDVGSAFLFLRNSANTGFDAAVTLANPSPAYYDLCGSDVAVGDISNDGRADIVLGCWMADGGATDAGSFVLFRRNATNDGFAVGEYANPNPAASDWCGFSVAIGDVNADGLGDVVAGCRGNDAGATNAGGFVLFRRNATNNGFVTGEVTRPVPIASDLCGSSVAVGDFTGDGLGDVAMGCPWADDGGDRSGTVVTFRRNAANNGFDFEADLVHPAPVTIDMCYGTTITDIDGDRRHDVVVSCSERDSGAGNAGAAVAFLRSTDGSSFLAGRELSTPTPGTGAQCGVGLATGDVDADGRSDVVLGCPYHDGGGTDNGRAVVYSDRSTVVRTTRVNQQPGRVSAVTVALTRRANRAAMPLVEASANGGTNWESVTLGAAHTFATQGNDLRLRVRMPQTPTARMTQLVHDLTIDYTYNAHPNAPVLVSPANGASTADTTPDLTATFDDPEAADTGTLHFEVCTVAVTAGQSCTDAGGTVVASGSTAGGIADGANGTWTPSTALAADATYHWHARGEDQLGQVGSWSSSRSLTISSAVTVTIDTTSHALGSVLPGADVFASSIVTVETNDPDGYTLTATDEHDTWGADCACASQIADWTGTDAAPSTWSAGLGPYTGVTVRDVSGTLDARLAKWGAANAAGWPENDTTNNLYAGLELSTSIVLHQNAAPTTAPHDDVVLTWRAVTDAATAAGTYDATVAVTAIANP